MGNLPRRKTIRLEDYDYSQNGAYFVTICAADKAKIFGAFVQTTTLDQPHIELTLLGRCVDETIKVANDNDGIAIDKYVIMPNHIHLIIILYEPSGDRGRSPLQYVVRNIKSYVTKWARRPVWQKSFYEHVIRNHHDYTILTSKPSAISGRKLMKIVLGVQHNEQI